MAKNETTARRLKSGIPPSLAEGVADEIIDHTNKHVASKTDLIVVTAAQERRDSTATLKAQFAAIATNNARLNTKLNIAIALLLFITTVVIFPLIAPLLKAISG